MQRGKSSLLVDMLSIAFDELRAKDSKSVSLYVNDCIHAHIGIIPFRTAPDPPSMHKAILLISRKEELQRLLPVDSASVVRRVIDAADPQKTLKDHMIELGLPLSAIQRVAQHLVYWGRAVIINPVDLSSSFSLSAKAQAALRPNSQILADFKNCFTVEDGLFYSSLGCISLGNKLHNIAEILANQSTLLSGRISDIAAWLLQRGVIQQKTEFYYYTNHFIDKNPILAKQQASQIPLNFARGIPQAVKKRFSQQEMRAIYSKLGCDVVK